MIKLIKQLPDLGVPSVLVLCVVLLAVFAQACNEDEGHLPYDTYADHAKCGGESWAREANDGPCTRCRTEAGMFRSGRNGQLCGNPYEIYLPIQVPEYWMILFDSLPVDSWPSDTFFMSRAMGPSSVASLGNFGVIGFPAYDRSQGQRGAFYQPPCPRVGAAGATWLEPWIWDKGPIFLWLSTENGDLIFDENESFKFTILSADVNSDCYEDWGHTTGFVRGDTLHMEIAWKVMLEPRELFGDTLFTSRAIGVAPPWQP